LEEISDVGLLEEVVEAVEEVELLDDMPVSNVQLFHGIYVILEPK
jgi:hypothetical protein